MTAEGPRDGARRVELPSANRLMLIAFAAVLGPGIAVYVVLRFGVGMGNGAAGLIGLVAMFGGLGWYPTYLRRLGRRLEAQRDER